MELSEFEVNGLTMKSSVNENEYDKRVNGTYESKFVNWFIDNKDSIDVFLDVGAYCGFYGLHMANEGVPVISFEPSKEAFDVMKNNIISNDFEWDIKTYNKVVSNVTGDKIDGGIGGCEFWEGVSDIDHKGNDIVETITIEKALGNYYLTGDNRAPSPYTHNIAVKIDTEGMELQTLQGIKRWWPYIKYLCIEFHPSYVDNKEITKALNYIEDVGMTQLDIDADPYNENCNIRFERG